MFRLELFPMDGNVLKKNSNYSQSKKITRKLAAPNLSRLPQSGRPPENFEASSTHSQVPP